MLTTTGTIVSPPPLATSTMTFIWAVTGMETTTLRPCKFRLPWHNLGQLYSFREVLAVLQIQAPNSYHYPCAGSRILAFSSSLKASTQSLCVASPTHADFHAVHFSEMCPPWRASCLSNHSHLWRNYFSCPPKGTFWLRFLLSPTPSI